MEERCPQCAGKIVHVEGKYWYCGECGELLSMLVEEVRKFRSTGIKVDIDVETTG